LISIGRILEAKACFILSLYLQPNSWAFNQLAQIYEILGQKLIAIECKKNAIILDPTYLLSYITLSQDFKQNDDKRSINECMK
jgi:tetratricopeptide (TPR) repeat protein